jgi:hypothetical protein
MAFEEENKMVGPEVVGQKETTNVEKVAEAY